MRRVTFRHKVHDNGCTAYWEWKDGILLKITDTNYFIELLDGTLECTPVYSVELKFYYPTEQKLKDIQACSQTDMSNWDVEDILQFGADD